MQNYTVLFGEPLLNADYPCNVSSQLEKRFFIHEETFKYRKIYGYSGFINSIDSLMSSLMNCSLVCYIYFPIVHNPTVLCLLYIYLSSVLYGFFHPTFFALFLHH